MKNKIRTIFRVHFVIISPFPPDVCDSLTSSLLEFPTFESDVNFYYTHYMLIHIIISYIIHILDCLAKTILLRTINHLNYNVKFHIISLQCPSEHSTV